MNFDATGAGHHRRATRTGCLKPSKQDRILGVGGIALQVVQHSSASGHAARRNDDLWHRIDRERFRLFRRSDVCRNAARPPTLRFWQSMVSNVPTEDVARIDSHGAVQVDRHIL